MQGKDPRKWQLGFPRLDRGDPGLYPGTTSSTKGRRASCEFDLVRQAGRDPKAMDEVSGAKAFPIEDSGGRLRCP